MRHAYSCSNRIQQHMASTVEHHSIGSNGQPAIGLKTSAGKDKAHHLESPASSGWKAVASSVPCFTATTTLALPTFFCSTGVSWYSHSTSTSCPTSRIAGARMNTARYGRLKARHGKLVAPFYMLDSLAHSLLW